MHGHSPTVTVLMPVYNGARYLPASIESVLAQTHDDLELLVIDDASTDRSAEIIGSYSDPRIRLVTSPTRGGPARARNRGIDLARGRCIAMQDADDCAVPRRLARQLAFLDRHPDHVMVGSWWKIVDQEGRETGRVKRPPVDAAQIRARLLFGGCLLNSTTMFRTEVLRQQRFREDYPQREDVDLWIRIARRYALGNVPEFLIAYRDHPEGTSKIDSQRNRACHAAIVRAQLDELGAAYDERDVERHALLRSAKRVPAEPEFVDWARDWLERLGAANRRTAYCPADAFDRVLGEKWFSVCRGAARKQGVRAWLRFAASSLSRSAARGMPARLAVSVRHRLGERRRPLRPQQRR